MVEHFSNVWAIAIDTDARTGIRGDSIFMTMQGRAIIVLTRKYGEDNNASEINYADISRERRSEKEAILNGSIEETMRRFITFPISDATNVNDLVITDQNKARIIQRLLEANLGEDIWNQLVQDNPNIATRLANAKIQEDRLAVLHRFEEMLQDNTLAENNWQDFFEENTWIFGYGLRYQILRVIQPQPNYGGVAVDGRGGQRGDFLTATEAETRFTCLVEIKKTTTPLLQREQYRNGVWGASNELTGAVSQIQVNCAQWETDARTERNREQLPRIYTVSPKGIVVIGKTSELNNWDKRNSFERFRQELRCPEVLTYDELYERAKFIAEGPAPLDEDTDFDMPF